MVEYQRLDHDVIVREATLQTSEFSTYDSRYIGRLIALIGKGGGGKSHVLDATITTLFQTQGWSMSNMIMSTNTVKSDYLINACTIFSPK